MAIVGTASVKIVADTRGFRPKVRAELGALRGPIASIGDDLGDRFAKSFNKASTKSLGDTRAYQQMGQNAARAFNQGMQQELARGGQSGGRAYSQGFDNEVRRGIAQSMSSGIRSSERNAGRDARSSGSRVGALFAEGVSRAMDNGLTRTMNSSFGRAAQQAANSFTIFYAKSGAIYGIVSSLAGALSTLASGLYLVGTAAVSAASSVAALGGVLGAALQGGLAVGIAFKGVFSTLSQGLKASQAASKASGDAGVANANRIADAQRNLDRVRMQNQERIQTAVQKVKDAEVDLTRAIREQEFAQRALTRARKEAREELEQLAFDAEDAALAQERAALTLEQAYAEMMATQNLPVDDRTRREAELSYKEAELNYRVSKDRVQDLAREQRRAARTGIEGTRAYSDAQKDLNSANEKVAQAERAKAEALQDEAKARRDAAQAEADAQRQLARALADTTSAANSAASAASAFDEAMKKLSPSAQSFVRGLLAMRDRFTEFKKAVQEPFFAQFNKSFFAAVNTLLPVFERGLAATSDTMGKLASQLATGVTRNAGMFEKTMQQNNEVLQIFTRRGENGRSMMDDLVTVFLRLWTTLEPITKRFARFIRNLVDTAEAATDTKKELQGIEDFFDRAGDRAARFGDMFKSIFNTFRNLAKAAEPAIDELLQYFQDAFKKMDIASGNSMKENRKFFKGVVENLKPMLDLIGKITIEFLKLGNNKSVGETFKRLQDAVPYLGKIFENGAALGPVLANIAVNFARLMAALSQGEGEGKGVLNYLFKMANWVVTALANLAENPVFQAIFSATAKPIAILKALSLFSIGLKLAGQVLFGYMLKGAGVIRGAARFFSGIFTTRSLRGGIASFQAGNDKDVTRGDIRITSAVDRTKLAVDASANRIVAAIRTLRLGGTGAPVYAPGTKAPKVTTNTNPGVKPSATKVGPMVNFPTGKVADDAAKSAGKMSKAFSGLGKAFRFLGGPLGIILMLLPALIGPLTEMWNKNEKLREAVGKLFKIFEQVSGIIDQALKPVFEELLKAIVPVVIELADELAPVFEDVMKMFQEEVMPTIQEIAGVLVDVLVPVIKIAAKIMAWWIKMQMELWKKLIPIIMPIIRFLVKALGVTLVAAITAVVGNFRTMWRIIRNLWENIGRPVFQAVMRFFRRVAEDIRDKINAIKGFFTGMWDRVKTVVNNVKSKFGEIKEKIVAVKDALKTPIDNLAGLFDRIYNRVNTALKGIPDLIQKYILDPVNKVLKFLGLPEIKINGLGLGAKSNTKASKKAHGGIVGGNGGPTSDDQPHYLSTGEYVVRASSVRKYGRATLDAINHGTLSSMEDGDTHDSKMSLTSSIFSKIRAPFNKVKEFAERGLVNGLERIFSNVISNVDTSNGFGKIALGFISILKDHIFKFAKREKEKKDASEGGYGYDIPGASAEDRKLLPFGNGRNSALFIRGLIAAAKLAGVTMQIMQGGYRPATSYSGTSHGKDAADLGPASLKFMNALRRIVGAAWLRNVPGARTAGSGAHIHVVPIPGAGWAVSNSQPSSYLARGDGLGGRDTYPFVKPDMMLNSASGRALLKKRGILPLAFGGTVKATPGGVLSLIGEAGRNERVEPLDPQGLSVRDRAIIEQLARQHGAGGGNTVVRVYIGDRELRDIVDYQVVKHEHNVARAVAYGRRTK